MSTSDSSLSIQVQVWSRTTWSGHALMSPVSELDKAELGPEAKVESALRRFLEHHLERAPAPVLAQFSLPEPVEVRTVRVLVPRLDLPRRLRLDTPLDVSALVIPSGSPKPDEPADAWVVVPTLDHTFFVPKDEDLDAAVAQEVVRMAAVLKPEPEDYFDLLPPRDEGLVTLQIDLPRDAGGLAGAKQRRKLIERRRRAEAEEVLASVGRRLTEPPGFVPGPDSVGLDVEAHRLKAMLTGKARLSALLVGAPRVGKTELLWSVLRGPEGRARSVWATSGAQLIAGMAGLGQWQERVRRVMEAVETLDAVLYLDDVADLFGEGSHGIDIPSAMRPYLEEGRARVVAEVTPTVLDRLENRNVAFFSAFNRIRLEAQGRDAAQEALRRRLEFDAKSDPDGPQLLPEAIGPLVELTDRYFPYRPFPAKALRLYQSVRAIAAKQRTPDGKIEPVGAERVLEAFSLESGIPTFLLRDDIALKAAKVRAAFEKRLVGQGAAVQAVVDTICVVKAALQPTGKPLATFLFVGPTGVGKTELARTLATYLFGREDRMVRFDMSEFGDPLAADRLIRGTARQEGLLTRRVRTQPFSVLLLDEIEKADRSVFDLLLQVLGEGRLTDARGQTTYFHNTIVVMTSNLGAAHRHDALGFDAEAEVDGRYYVRQVEKSFRPELVNRLDRIITFSALARDQILAVTRLALDKLERRKGLVDRGIRLDIDEGALGRLALDGYSEAYGARAIRRHLDDVLAGPLARLLAKAGPAARGATAVVREATSTERPAGRSLGRLSAHGLAFFLVEGQQREAKRDTRHVTRIAGMRQTVERLLALDRVEGLQAKLQLVRAQLNAGGEGSAKRRKKAQKRARRAAEEHAQLSQEQHRLRTVLDAATSSRDALVAAEEVALMALLAGEETLSYLEEAQAAEQVFLRNLAYLLLAEEPRRDEVTLMVQEVGPKGAFRQWLVPLFAALDDRGWTAELHVPGERARAGERWEELRPWGPPRGPAELERRIRDPKESLSGCLLLRVRGPYAGVLLALEQGLHEFERRGDKGGTPKLYVHQVSMRFEPAEPKDWKNDLMAPLPSPTHSNHARRKPVRKHLAAHDRLELGRAAAVLELPLEVYWPRFEEVAVRELLAFEDEDEGSRDRDEMFLGAFEGGKGVTQ